MSCNCNEKHPQKETPCERPKDRKGIVKVCDLCDPCEENVSNVKLCAFIVPTLEEGRYYRNSFIFVEEDESVYYISDDRSEIPFGSRPKFIDDFDPTDPTVSFKSTVVYDVKNSAAYIYDPDGVMVASGLTPRPISSILAGEGIVVQSEGGDYTISTDPNEVASKVALDELSVIVGGLGDDITNLEREQEGLAGDLDDLEDLVDRVHNTADEADERSVLARAEAAAAQQTANSAVAALPGKQDKLTAGDNITLSGNVISATDTTYDVFTGATAQSGGTYGLVPGPRQGDQNKVLSGNGEWVDQQDTTYTAGTGLNLNGTELSVDLTTIAEKSDIPTTAAEVHALPDTTKYGASLTLAIDSSTYVVTAQLKDQDGNALGSAQTIDLPLESVVVNGSYDSQTKEVVLTLQSGSTIRFSVADLVSGLQSEITAQSPLDADLVDDSTSANKFVTSSDITAWNGKQNALTAGSNISISGTTISATDTTYSNFTGATSQDAGAAGLVPAPAAGDEGKFLSGNGLWTTVSQYTLPIASANDLGGIKVGTNLSIDSITGVLSATDTTYSGFTGTDGTAAGTAGLVPAPATTDAGKFLKADGTWDTAGAIYTAGSGIDITSNTISATNTGLARVLTVDDYNYHVSGNDDDGIAVWLLPAGIYQSPYMPIYDTSSHRYLNYSGLILVGGNMGAGYRTITLFNTLGDTDSFILAGDTGQKQTGDYTTGVFVGKRSSTGSPSSSTKGKVGQMWENTTNHKLYMCTSATGGTYVWEEVAFGGGGGNAISAADWAALWADTVENINGVGV